MSRREKAHDVIQDTARSRRAWRDVPTLLQTVSCQSSEKTPRTLRPQNARNIYGIFVYIKTDEYDNIFHDLPPWLWLCIWEPGSQV